MKKIKNVVIIGLGALGAIYADKLARTDEVNLYILVDQARKERYEKNGINYNGTRLDFNYILPNQTDIKADLIIVAVKSNGLLAAVEMMKNVVASDTIIISLLNGISSERIIGDKYGMEHLLYAVYLAHGSTNINNVITHDGINRIIFGEADNSQISEKVMRCQELFDKADIAYTVPQDMLYELWRKAMIIVGFNQSSVLFDSEMGIFQSLPAATDFAKKLVWEVAAVAEQMGIVNTKQMAEDAIAAACKLQPTMKASIYQDHLMKRPMEIDIFSGEICRLGQELGVPTPYNEVVRDILTVLDIKNSMQH